jgi:hypothetical protein
MGRRMRGHLVALCAYGVLTLVLTYPLAIHLGTAIPGPYGDNWQYYWNLWWMRQFASGQVPDLFHTNYLYYPNGVSLYFDTLTIFDAFVTLPIQMVFNAIAAYNTAVLMGFAFSGWTAYLLADYVVGMSEQGEARAEVDIPARWLAAFAAGFIFTFCPYHFAHLMGHLNLVAMEWIPLYVLFLLKATQTQRWRFVPMAGLFLALTALADWYYVMYLVMFTVLYVVVRVVTTRPRFNMVMSDLVRVGLIGAVFVVIASPILIPTLVEAMTTSYAVYPPVQTLHHSPDLLAFFAPSPFHPIWGRMAEGWENIYHSPLAEKIVYLGYVPLVLSGIAIWREWRRVRLWLIVAVVFFTLALGPLLHLGGQTTFTSFDTTVPLPYLLLYYLPLVPASRAVSRFEVMVVLSLGIMAAWGLVVAMRAARGQQLLGGLNVRLAIPVVALLLIGFEFLAVPYQMSAPQVPAFLAAIAAEKGDFAILDVPFSMIRSRYLLYQTVHEKRIVGGYISRSQPYRFVQVTPAVQQLVNLARGPDINTIALRKMGENVLGYYNVGYVVVHKKLDKPDAVEKALDMATRIFGRGPDYEDDMAAAFRVRPAGRALFVCVGDGWYDKESTEVGATRWMGEEATLVLVSSTSGPATLELQASSFREKRNVQLLEGDSEIARFTVLPGDPQKFEAEIPSLKQGETVVRIMSEEPPVSPASLGMGDDSRRLSVSVSNVAISD